MSVGKNLKNESSQSIKGGLVRSRIRFSLVCISIFASIAPVVAQTDGSAKSDCLTALGLLFEPTTSHYRDLKKVLGALPANSPILQHIKNKDFQVAIWNLRESGARETADLLSKYTKDELLFSQVEKIERIEIGATAPQKVTLQGHIQGVFKPNPAHWKTHLTSPIPSAEAEVIAYQLDRAMGLNMVPITVERQIGPYRGTFQLWVKSDALEVSYESMRDMDVFDYLISNQDRKVANYLTADGRAVAIDHGLAFGTKLPRNANQVFDGFPLTDRFYKGLKERLTPEVIEAITQGKLPREIIDQIKARRRKLLEYHESLDH